MDGRTSTSSRMAPGGRSRSWLYRVLHSVALPAWLLSVLLHFILMTTLFVWAGGVGGSGESAAEEVEHEVVVQLTPSVELPAAPPLDTAPPVPPAAEPGPRAPFDLDAPARQQLDEGLKEMPDRIAPAPPRLDLVEGLNTDLKLDAPLPRIQVPAQPLGTVETEFFGAPARGNKFVYVIDRSASMQFALGAAKRELLESLDRLPPTAEFQVILYDLEARVMEVNGQQGMIPASRENKLRTARLLDTIRSEGGTDHVKALKRALALGPQIVYFLTDADELKPGQVQELTAINERGPRAQIHCIELSLVNEGRRDNPMRVLARDNRGDYRGIDLMHRRP